jgi:GH15 family glucan-1,4-alpha-glucosidase
VAGAIVGAPNHQPAGQLGGARNWDYRYTRMRDAAFTVYALLTLGFTEVAHAFMEWVQARIGDAVPQAFTDIALISAAYNLDRRLALGTR